MNNKISSLAMAFAVLVNNAENERSFIPMSVCKEAEPVYKRKKCKSCRNINHCHGAYKHPNKQACSAYSKRK